MAHLMIVDDDQDFAEAAATALRAQGHEVSIELDPHNAVPRMKSDPPDLAILDVMFPEDVSGGFELARAMKENCPELKGVRILMLTAVNAKFPLGFSASDIDSEWLSVSDFAEKPIEFEELCRRVDLLLNQNGPA
ncbi:MAG TPA: response regulator [Phycisphaerae bacterium]|nr:response regulator [Phycisphaerae bacterium]